MTKRVLVGAILHETNTFNAVPTRLADFAGRYLVFGEEQARARLAGTGTEVGGFLEAAAAHGWEIVLPVAAACGPSGPLAAADWAALRQAMLSATGRFDGVLLALHGAMVSEDCLDPEGELLAALRARHGERVPIVATLDMHANVSARMVAAADAFFPYRTYPHVDHFDCAVEAAGALARLMQEADRDWADRGGTGRLTRTVLARPPMIDAADHGRTGPPGPMNALLGHAAALAAARPGVVSAGLTIGFPWADVPDVGPAAMVSVMADAAVDPRALALDLGHRLWESRAETQLDFADIETAIAAARAPGDDPRPLVLADFADNPAGGAYGDSPNLLRAMLEAGLENAAFATICDPAAVALAGEAGEGAVLELALGGRLAPEITPPLALRARVLRLHPGTFRCEGPVLRGLDVDMGPMALLEAAGLRIVVASRALAVTDLNLFRALGIEPATLSVIGLKSRNHLRAAFAPISRDILLVDAGGIATMRLSQIPYSRIRRPLWPLDPLAETPNLEHIHVFDTASRPEERSLPVDGHAQGR